MKKQCACGCVYNPRNARSRGTWSLSGEVLLLTDCPNCGSTGGSVLVPHPEDVRARVEANPN